MILLTLILLAGAGSAIAYLFRRKWIDALLVALASAALALMLGDFSMPAGRIAKASIASGDKAPSVGNAAVVQLAGDGLRAAQWRDLPARPLVWTPPAGDTLRLDFPRRITPGRFFTLTATMPGAAARRLQLLAENGQVIAEAAGSGASLGVQWLPSVAETLVLKARLLDAAGKLIDEGPVPFEVRDAAPLQVRGRFGSPSFDARALNELLTNSKAVLDWQVTLGKTVTRTEAAGSGIAQPNLVVADAAYVERLPGAARAALLAQAAGGTPLMILGANAGDTQFWSRTLQLQLKEQPEAKPAGSPLALATAPFNPAPKAAGPWSSAGDRIWSRPWEKGRIVWLGVSDWHRYAIADPRALGQWWQDVLDRAGVRREQDVAWLDPGEMPLPGQRLEVCAQGVSGEVSFPALKQELSWRRMPERADAACVAVWPQASGWLAMQARGASAQVFVFSEKDWPLWQKAQRRDATALYAVRTPTAANDAAPPLPQWPFALLFASSMLLLWWRERR